MKKLTPFLITYFLLLAGCEGLAGLNEVVSSTYATHAEAVARKAFDSGWLPSEMPSSARSIVEVHSIESGEMWVRFSSNALAVSSFVRECSIDPNYVLPDPRRTRRNVPWWPKGLEDGGDKESLKGLEIYVCPAMHHAGNKMLAGVAVDHLSDTVWYWVRK